MRPSPVVSIGAGGRTRTGTAVRPTDFKSSFGHFSQQSLRLTTMPKSLNFTGLLPFYYSGFRPTPACQFRVLDSQKSSG